jgi:xanthine dehydrogenase accessory factor
MSPSGSGGHSLAWKATRAGRRDHVSAQPVTSGVEPHVMSPAEETAATVAGWLRDGHRVVAAPIVAVEGSTPFDVGASLFVRDDGTVEGSITGGCVEAAVAQEALELLDGRRSPGTLSYGVSDQLAGTVGLMCGGTVHVFVHELTGESRLAGELMLEAKAERRECALATVLDGPAQGQCVYIDRDQVVGGPSGTESLTQTVVAEARTRIEAGRSLAREFGQDGSLLGDGVTVLITVSGQRPLLVLFGAVDYSAAVASVATAMGYRVIVADPRPAFLTSPRFMRVAETLCAWPQEVFDREQIGPRDAVIAFSHDPKLDVPALMRAFASNAGYIGALGSRRTTAERELRLRGAGATDYDLDRLHAPCGLDIGARTPEETAIAILAELTAYRAWRHGGPLRDSDGSIRARAGGRRAEDRDLMPG